MTIMKTHIQENFSIIPNEISQNKNLSFEATGLLVLMLSLPDDWIFHKSWVKEQKIKCGRDKLSGMFNELKEAGYLRKVVKQTEGGKLDGVEWLVFPTAQLIHRTTEKQSDGKPATTKNTSIQSKQDTNTNSVIDDLFEQFWSAGMVKVNKKKALTVFKAVMKKQAIPAWTNTIMVEDIKARLSANQFGFDKMHPTTYLNGERWNDDIQTPVNNPADLSSTDWAGDKVFDPTYLER